MGLEAIGAPVNHWKLLGTGTAPLFGVPIDRLGSNIYLLSDTRNSGKCPLWLTLMPDWWLAKTSVSVVLHLSGFGGVGYAGATSYGRQAALARSAILQALFSRTLLQRGRPAAQQAHDDPTPAMQLQEEAAFEEFACLAEFAGRKTMYLGWQLEAAREKEQRAGRDEEARLRTAEALEEFVGAAMKLDFCSRLTYLDSFAEQKGIRQGVLMAALARTRGLAVSYR
ncbi:hypothetical protein WJX72_004817 [[Myrmecia] bisecta]|uniref:Uncharacterized protein n=1 Tax=[Myrmecia] bisecta TaxID=41462 RepID=A0AAW1Q230_9CHLO